MSPNDFFAFASKLFLSFPAGPACHRSVISRAYYGAYHSALDLVERELGIRCKSGISEHLYLQRLLKESQVDEAIELGQSLDNLHQSRKEADYDLDSARPDKRDKPKLAWSVAWKSFRSWPDAPPMKRSNFASSRGLRITRRR